MRSSWKGYFIKNSEKLDNSSTLLNTMLKKKVLIYDGKSFKSLLVERKMIGLKVGEFIFTRKIGVTHKKKVINKKGKKK
jgi:ribosomal protein S19